MCVGDPVTIGEYPQTLNDVDVTATGLLSLITQEFNEGATGVDPRSASRRRSSPAPRWLPSAADLDREVRLAAQEGAGRAPRSSCRSRIYSVEPLRRFLRGLRSRPPAARSRCPCWWGCCRSLRPATPSSCTTRCRGSRSPNRCVRAWRRAGEDGWRAGLAMAEELMVAAPSRPRRRRRLRHAAVRPFDLAAEVVEAARRV